MAPFFVCMPQFFSFSDDEFLVLACDGLWDRVTHEETSLFVSKLLHYKTLEHAAEFLLDEALGTQ